MVKVLIIQKKRLPVKLVYLEEYQRIDNAFNREKQIQGWSRVKKETLILNKLETPYTRTAPFHIEYKIESIVNTKLRKAYRPIAEDKEEN